jgi:hypothetical protein
MDVTDILRDRMQEPPGFQRMVTLSIAAHVVLAGRHHPRAARFDGPPGERARGDDDFAERRR